MTGTSDSRDLDCVRDKVLDAAIQELTGKKISSFTLEGVAARAAVPSDDVRGIWANTPELLAASLRAYGQRNLPIPDTGTLRGDLLAFARSYAATVNTSEGRRVLD
jgi:hypothetical protein